MMIGPLFDAVLDYLVNRGPYLLYVIVLSTGIYLVLSHRNLLKALVGISLVQSAIILYFILLAARRGGSIPIIDAGDDRAVINPVPHALMLTAIVVGVATLGVGLALLFRIQDESGSIEDRREDRR